MLRNIACLDMFAELLARRDRLRSAAAMFIDMTTEADRLLTATDESLDDLYDELSDMWTLSMTGGPAFGVSLPNDLFNNLMMSIVWQKSQQSPAHQKFYESITGGQLKEATLLRETVAWMTCE